MMKADMKFSIAASLLILAIGAGFAWRDHSLVGSEQKRHATLSAQAEQLGLSISTTRSGEIRVTKRDRGQQAMEQDAKAAAAEFIALAKLMEKLEGEGKEPDEALQKRMIGMMNRMMSMDASQMGIVIAEFRNTPEFNDEMKLNMVGLALTMLSTDHPQKALTLLTSSGYLVKGNEMASGVASNALANWAKTDSSGAIGWLKKNGAEHFTPEKSDELKRGLLRGIAESDIPRAFQAIAELDIARSDAPRWIMEAARTPAERTNALAALRTYLTTLPDDESREEANRQAMGSIASRLGQDGFDSAETWLEGANLSKEELAAISSSLNRSVKQEDTGRWITWMGDNLPADKLQPVQRMISRWTEQDYQAAGNWLAAAPASPAKDEAVRGYAETVAAYEPETAAQWAMTLPEGETRRKTLERIYQRWPGKDDSGKAAAEAFAEKHKLNR